MQNRNLSSEPIIVIGFEASRGAAGVGTGLRPIQAERLGPPGALSLFTMPTLLES